MHCVDDVDNGSVHYVYPAIILTILAVCTMLISSIDHIERAGLGYNINSTVGSMLSENKF